jgi:hypothetical protein
MVDGSCDRLSSTGVYRPGRHGRYQFNRAHYRPENDVEFGWLCNPGKILSMHEYDARLRQDDCQPGADLPELVSGYADDAERHSSGLMWLPSLPAGFYEVKNEHYDDSYFEHYAELECLPISKQIIDARIGLVKRHTAATVVDFGIGSGTFVRSLSDTTGFDINPKSVAWLRARGLYVDPWSSTSRAVTFWDSIEHVRDFGPLLRNIREWLFISIPIFSSSEHVISSKHFKPMEHYWYFTQDGLVKLMRDNGFDCMEINREEIRLGREDILSFAFTRL